MKKRAATAENPWKVHATPVVVPDAGVRLRAVVGVLLAETGTFGVREWEPHGASGDVPRRQKLRR